jgi:hypothetical protein
MTFPAEGRGFLGGACPQTNPYEGCGAGIPSWVDGGGVWLPRSLGRSGRRMEIIGNARFAAWRGEAGGKGGGGGGAWKGKRRGGGCGGGGHGSGCRGIVVLCEIGSKHADQFSSPAGEPGERLRQA